MREEVAVGTYFVVVFRERRVPLCPSHVAELVKSGVKVVVEPSKSRIFPDVDYAKVGAQLSNDLSPCDVILGVKQPDQVSACAQLRTSTILT